MSNGWAWQGEALARMLRKGSARAIIEIEKYPLAVDYDLSVEDAVRFGQYDRTQLNEQITSEHFPTERSGKAELMIELVHCNWRIWTQDALHEIYNMGMRPSELRELLAFSRVYPDIQLEFPIVALGSIWRSRNGHSYVSFISSVGGKRGLGLYSLEDVWSAICRFAAIRSILPTDPPAEA